MWNTTPGFRVWTDGESVGDACSSENPTPRANLLEPGPQGTRAAKLAFRKPEVDLSSPHKSAFSMDIRTFGYLFREVSEGGRVKRSGKRTRLPMSQ